MAKQIKNRREDLYINEVPPEILDKTSLETALSTDGFVKNTDYPSSSKAGVIKIGNGYGAAVTGAGILTCSIRTAEQFNNDGSSMFISKGTLLNVFAALIQQYIKEIFLANVMEPDTSKNYAVTMEYNSVTQEWGLDFQAL